MFQFHIVLLFMVCFAFSISIDLNDSSSRSNYNSNLNQPITTFNKETDRLDTNLKKKSHHQELLKERLIVITTISCISIGIMTIIVITYIAIKYFGNNARYASETNEQTIPLDTSRQTKRKNKMVSTTAS
jgi:hypothetical protein